MDWVKPVSPSHCYIGLCLLVYPEKEVDSRKVASNGCYY